MGGGNFVVPVQTVTDFLSNRLSGGIAIYFILLVFFFSYLSFFFLILFPSPVSNFLYTYLDWFYFVVTSVPQSSYRLGVKASKLHELFPDQITEALQHAISMFEKEV